LNIDLFEFVSPLADIVQDVLAIGLCNERFNSIEVKRKMIHWLVEEKRSAVEFVDGLK